MRSLFIWIIAALIATILIVSMIRRQRRVRRALAARQASRPVTAAPLPAARASQPVIVSGRDDDYHYHRQFYCDD
jgi:hypothetical protein